MDKSIDTAYFTRKMFLRSVLPAPLAGIGLALAEMGDTILAGHAIGVDGLAAIGFISPLFLLAAFFVFGLSTGGAVVFSNFMHEGKTEKALDIFNFFLRISAVIGFGITAAGFLLGDELLYLLGTTPEDGAVFEMAKSYVFYILLGIPLEILMEVVTTYLRYDDADTLSISLQSAAGIINLLVSALLLLVFDWGIAGCSFGFFISNLITLAIAVGYMLLGRGILRFRARAAGFAESWKSLRLGFSTASEYVFDALFTLLAIHLIAEMSGTDGVAVFNVIENLSLLFIFIYEYIGKTAQPMFTAFFSECNFAELHRMFRYCLGYSLALGILVTLLIVFWPESLVLLFGLDDIGDIGMAYHAARIFCVGTIFMGVCLLLQNYLQSEEDEKGAFLVVFLRRIGASVPIALLLAPFGFYVFWFVYPLAEIATLLILFGYYRWRGAKKTVARERVYAATFLGSLDALMEQLEAVEAFAKKWGADARKSAMVRLTIEELAGFMRDQTGLRNDPILTQFTLIAREDGVFEIHLRDDADRLNPFELPVAPVENLLQDGREEDVRTLGLYVVKSHARNLFYRNYHGFNTFVITV